MCLLRVCVCVFALSASVFALSVFAEGVFALSLFAEGVFAFRSRLQKKRGKVTALVALHKRKTC